LIFFSALAGVLLLAGLTLYKFAFQPREPDNGGGSEKKGNEHLCGATAQAHQGSFRSSYSVGSFNKNAMTGGSSN
jgi:hypothetical protein